MAMGRLAKPWLRVTARGFDPLSLRVTGNRYIDAMAYAGFVVLGLLFVVLPLWILLESIAPRIRVPAWLYRLLRKVFRRRKEV